MLEPVFHLQKTDKESNSGRNDRMKKVKKEVWGWAMYDWANSAFATTVMAGFFPLYFKKYLSFGADVTVSTAQLGFGNSVSSLLVALLAPLLGAVADRRSARKAFLLFFAYLGALMTSCLFLIQQGQWVWAIFIYAMGNIGFSGANIFYDSLLPEVASESDIDFVSGLGFGMGYLGGGILFAVNVFMTMKPALFGLSGAAQAVRFSFLSVALWWGGFTLFTLFWVKEEKREPAARSLKKTFSEGLSELVETFRKIRVLKKAFLFLIAYWFYIDGVDTIIKMAVDYGMSIGFDSNDLILALLLVQFVGFPSAILFGKLGQSWGIQKGIYLAIGVYILATIWGAMISQRYEFYILAVIIGLVQGGIQALSRSYYSRLIPKGQTAQFFGFYNMLGKFAAILGPALMAAVALAARTMLMPQSPSPLEMTEAGRLASRLGIASISLLFIIGGLLFHVADKARAESR